MANFLNFENQEELKRKEAIIDTVIDALIRNGDKKANLLRAGRDFDKTERDILDQAITTENISDVKIAELTSLFNQFKTLLKQSMEGK